VSPAVEEGDWYWNVGIGYDCGYHHGDTEARSEAARDIESSWVESIIKRLTCLSPCLRVSVGEYR
jgi:hypothetical protein